MILVGRCQNLVIFSILLILSQLDLLNRLEEVGTFLCPQVDVPLSSNIALARITFCDGWLLVEAELVERLCPWVIFILCYSDRYRYVYWIGTQTFGDELARCSALDPLVGYIYIKSYYILHMMEASTMA